MAERASVTQGLYIAPETVAGDGGAGFKILNGLDLEPGVKVDMQRYRPTGTKVETIIVPGKEWTEFDLSGMAQYSELHYLLAGVFGANQVSQPSTLDTSGKKWMFSLEPRDIDEVQTYGAVKGDSNFAEEYSYLLATEVNIDFSREGLKIDGNFIGHEAEFGGTLPHPVTSIPEFPVLPTEVSVYLDTTYGALGANKLTRALMLKQSIGDRHNPVWVLDAAEPSFVAHVETAPKFEVELTLEANTDGTDLIDSMRGGDTLFARIDCTGGDLAGSSTAYHQFQQDFALKIADVDKFSDEDGVYAIKYTLAVVSDAVDGLTYESFLVNKQGTF